MWEQSALTSNGVRLDHHTSILEGGHAHTEAPSSRMAADGGIKNETKTVANVAAEAVAVTMLLC